MSPEKTDITCARIRNICQPLISKRTLFTITNAKALNGTKKTKTTSKSKL